jgi:hypothetical protein
MPRPVAAALGLALFLAFPASAHAQLGGLVKKAKDKIAPPAATQSTDQPARLPGPPITGAVVDHLLLGLKAEKDAKDRAAAGAEDRARKEREAKMDPQARYYSCLGEKQKQDPAQPQMEKLGKDAEAAVNKGDNNQALQIAMQMQPLQLQMQQRAESACASVKPGAKPATPAQKAIQDAPVVPPEQAGATAAGLSLVEYGQVKELIYTYLGYGKRAGLTDEEKHAVDPKRAQLKDGFKSIGME